MVNLDMMAKSTPPPDDPRQNKGLDLAKVARPTMDAEPSQENHMLDFEVQDMSCGHCVAVITRTIQALDPGAQVLCDVPTHRVQVETARPREDVARALAEAGYPPTPVG
jgi:copper chaperone